MINTNKVKILFIFIFAAVLASAGWYYFRQQDKKKTQSPIAPLVSPAPPIQTTSTPGSSDYFINENGELVRVIQGGRNEFLITVENDMEIATQKGQAPEKDIVYTKGKVLDFWLSPDGEYIAYMALENFTSCCDSPPTIPNGSLWVMKKDGTDRKQIQIPKNYPGILRFDQWLPNSKSFIFHAAFPDESTQGRPFYEANVEAGHSKLFKGIDYAYLFGDVDGDDYLTTTVALAEPSFSSDGDKLAYRRGGIDGDEIWMANIDGTERKKLLGGINPINSVLEWSADGDFLIVTVIKGKYVFNKMGEPVTQ